MSSILRPVAAVLVAAAMLPAPALAAQAFAVTPAPAKLAPQQGALTLRAGDAVWIAPGDAEARGAAQWLVDTLVATRGVRLVDQGRRAAGDGRRCADARRSGGGGLRAGRLVRRAEIRAKDKAGLFYGAVSLWQLAAQPQIKGKVGAPLRPGRPHRRRAALRLARPDAGQRPPLPEPAAIKRSSTAWPATS
jgi:hexosaminidase